MPIYEYECSNCGAVVEQWQKITDKPLHTCPECKARRLQRLISNTSFQLKGTGWYVTDYAAKKPSSSKPSKPKDSTPKESSPKANDA